MTIIKMSDEKYKRANADLIEAVNFVNSLDEKLANDVIAAVMAVVLYQCRVGLGLIEDDDDDKLSYFERIDAIYREAAGDCYFCMDIDPNEVKPDDNTRVCMFCRIKLNNIFKLINS